MSRSHEPQVEHPSQRAGAGRAGFSLVEVLLASALLLIVAVGVAPLFFRSLVSNRSGSDATGSTHRASSRVEELFSVDFNHAAMAPTGGAIAEYYLHSDGQWHLGSPSPGEVAPWQRSTEITQHSLADLLDNGAFDTPLPATTDPVFVHLKLIEVTAANPRGQENPLSSRQAIVLQTLRPY
jgi:prepilin-type N-terminal cleavage/methylation domain-containing protein